jgi:hypothetical protein
MGRFLSAEPLAVAAHRPHEQQAVEHGLPGARMVDDGRVHFEQRGQPSPRRQHHPLAAEVVVALDQRLGPYFCCDALDRAARAETKHAVRRRPGDAVPVHALALLALVVRARAHDDGAVAQLRQARATSSTWTLPPVRPGTVWSEAT